MTEPAVTGTTGRYIRTAKWAHAPNRPVSAMQPEQSLLFHRVVVQVLSEPSLDFSYAHSLAFAIVDDLVAVDLAEAEISRFGMGEVESTHARAGPHRKRLGDQHSCIRLHIEQTPKLTLFRVIRARRITRSWPDAAIFLLNKISGAQALRATITPFIPHAFVQAFGESLSQAVGDGLRHDRVVVIVLGPVRLAQFFQADPAGYRECADVSAQTRFLRSDEVGERSARLVALLI